MFAQRPEPALVRARASGERVVATVRLAVTFLFGLVGSITAPQSIVFGLSVAAVLYAGFILLLSWKVPHSSLPWVTTMLDTTLITLALSVFVFYGEPLKVLTNKLYFEAYFFVLANSVLRYDWRLVAFTLVVVLLEFLGLASFVMLHWDVSTLEPPPDVFSGIYFSLRVLLLAATGISSVVVATWALHIRLLIGTDQLTGLPQRRPFLERIDEEFSRAEGNKATLSLALIDVDDFKQFNDRFGHVAGDIALKTLAGVLSKVGPDHRPARSLWRGGVHRGLPTCHGGSGPTGRRPTGPPGWNRPDRSPRRPSPHCEYWCRELARRWP